MKNTLNTISALRPVASIFDEYIWGDRPAETVPEKPKAYLDFNTPPLALVIAMQKGGKDTHQIFDTLIGVGTAPRPILLEETVSKQHQAEAAKIYNYFAFKHTMRRLKGEHISEFMLAVDDLCENRRRIDFDHVKVLVTLPRFYKENIETELLMSNHVSVDKENAVDLLRSINETVVFVKCIERRASRGNYNFYYWKRSNNQLLRVRIEANHIGNVAWNYLASCGKIKIKAKHNYFARIQGYEFFVNEIDSTAKVEPA